MKRKNLSEYSMRKKEAEMKNQGYLIFGDVNFFEIDKLVVQVFAWNEKKKM